MSTPEIVSVSGKVGVLERRLKFLEQQVQEGKFSEKALPYIMAEQSAISAAIEVLVWYAGDRQRSDTSSPLSVIRQLVELDPHCLAEELMDLQDQARELLKSVA